MSKANIEAREQEWLTTFNGGNAAGVAAIYHNDARVLPPNAEIITGRSDIESFCKEFIQTGAQLTFNVLTLHESPDLCAAVGTYVMTFPADSGVPNDTGKYVEVWVRENGTWSITDDIFNSDLPAPAVS